ncbi:hypothetical protein NUSPORA_00842 [Nucleospora cyclopteri]
MNISFDLNKFNQLEKEIENYIYIHMNEIPTAVEEDSLLALGDSPNVNATIHAYYDKLFKKTREQTTDSVEPVVTAMEDTKTAFNETFLETFHNKEFFIKCKESYANSLQIAKIFHLFFFLFHYHPLLYSKYSFSFFSAVQTFFLCFDQKEILNFLKEICLDGKMLNFYIEIHNLITEEIDEKVTLELCKYQNFKENIESEEE